MILQATVAMVDLSQVLSIMSTRMKLLMKHAHLTKLTVGIKVLAVHLKSSARTVSHQVNVGLKRILEFMVYLSTELHLEKITLFKKCFKEDLLDVELQLMII